MFLDFKSFNSKSIYHIILDIWTYINKLFNYNKILIGYILA